MKKSIEELVKKYSPEKWQHRIKKEMDELGLTFSNDTTTENTYESKFSKNEFLPKNKKILE